MKRPYLYLILLLTASSCGGDGGDEIQEPEIVNTAPSIPDLIYPSSNIVCINNNIIFEWSKSTDAEGNRITYRLEIAANNSFSPLLQTVTSFSESKLITLERGKGYFWRIKAIDNKSAESDYSAVNQFLTEGDGVTNHIPFSPNLEAPALNSEIDATSTTLSWTASDADGDSLKYDVYLDTNPNPTTKVSENQSENTFNALGLSAASTYYFKIVVKDDKKGVSIGQIWSFTTK